LAALSEEKCLAADGEGGEPDRVNMDVGCPLPLRGASVARLILAGAGGIPGLF
jgi:hypothetical protein